MIGTVIRENRELHRLTQPALGRRAGCSESLIRLYETGHRIPSAEAAASIAQALHAPEIAYAKCQSCPANLLSVAVICGDTHPNTQVLVALQESREAIAAVEAVAAHWGRAERRVVEHACDQLLDLVPMVGAAVASWCRQYSLDMKQIGRRHRAKLVQRGHVRGEVAA